MKDKKRRKTNAQTYRSAAIASVHDATDNMCDAGVLTKQTMRTFDASCLTKVRPMSHRTIGALRRRENVTCEVFAR